MKNDLSNEKTWVLVTAQLKGKIINMFPHLTTRSSAGASVFERNFDNKQGVRCLSNLEENFLL